MKTATIAVNSDDNVGRPPNKLLLLAGMVLQNSLIALIGRHTRTVAPKEDLYIVSHLIMVSEIGKLLLSFVLEHFTSGGKLRESVQLHILDNPRDALKIMVPAVLYFIQTTLLYLALSNLTAPMYQVTYQGKLVTTAIVSVIMLNRKYSLQQWICLVTLSAGVCIIVLGASSSSSSSSPSSKTDDDSKTNSPAGEEQSLATGLTAILVACFCSALAGVYFEKVVKEKSTNSDKKPPSVWMRNIQLAFFSICTNILQGAIRNDDSSNNNINKGYLFGFTFWVWVLIALQSLGGLLVAAVIKYADNVQKGLAAGVSVCVATGASTLLFGTPLSGQFSLGATVILVSVYLFSNPIKKKQKMDSSSSDDVQDDTSATAEMKMTVLPKY